MITAPAVTTTTTAEILRFQPESARTIELFSALRREATRAGIALTISDTFRNASDLLLLWGPGSPLRFASMQRQIARVRHVVAFDLAYWSRDKKLRVSIDAAHPQSWVMRRAWPTSRWHADPAPVLNHWKADGPIIVAGIGRKARVQYGAMVDDWEQAMIRACAVRFRRLVLYRRKQTDAPLPAGAILTGDGPIESVLAGASLLITWHSNVAVDAIRLGIPVICRDGAAAAVSPSALGDEDPTPLTPAVRDRFLANLAWFQWRPDEAAQLWAWLREALA